MDFDDWEKHFSRILDKEVEEYLDENSSELFVETPLKSKQQQKEQTKDELMKAFRLEDSENRIERALILIRDLLPKYVSADEWDVISTEFIQSDEALVAHFEAMEEKKSEQEDAHFSIAEMCGISEKTLNSCYKLGETLYKEKQYSDARALFAFLTAISPEVPEFWICSILCCNQMKQYPEAIELCKLGQQLFPENIAMYIHGANNCIANGDTTEAEIALDHAKKIIGNSPESKKAWGETYQYLKSRAGNYKKI